MSFDSMLTDLVTIKAFSHPAAGSGQMTVTYETTGTTGVHVRIEPLSAGAQQSILGRFPNAEFRMFCSKSTTIKEGYYVIDAAGITYEVLGVMNFFSHHQEVILAKKGAGV